MTAGGMVKLYGSNIDMNAPISGVNGMLKADTVKTTTVIAKFTHPAPATFGNLPSFWLGLVKSLDYVLLPV